VAAASIQIALPTTYVSLVSFHSKYYKQEDKILSPAPVSGPVEEAARSTAVWMKFDLLAAGRGSHQLVCYHISQSSPPAFPIAFKDNVRKPKEMFTRDITGKKAFLAYFLKNRPKTEICFSSSPLCFWLSAESPSNF